MILFARWCELQSRVCWATDPFGPYFETREGSAVLERMWWPTLLSPEDTPSQGTRDWPRISVDLWTQVRSPSIMEHLVTGRCSEELFYQGPGLGLLLWGPLGQWGHSAHTAQGQRVSSDLVHPRPADSGTSLLSAHLLGRPWTRPWPEMRTPAVFTCGGFVLGGGRGWNSRNFQMEIGSSCYTQSGLSIVRLDFKSFNTLPC